MKHWMIGGARPSGWWSCGLPRTALAVLLMLGAMMRLRAAEPEPPSKDFLEYLGTIEAEDDDWTLFDSTREPADSQEPPSPPKKEPSPPPQRGDEP